MSSVCWNLPESQETVPDSALPGGSQSSCCRAECGHQSSWVQGWMFPVGLWLHRPPIPCPEAGREPSLSSYFPLQGRKRRKSVIETPTHSKLVFPAPSPAWEGCHPQKLVMRGRAVLLSTRARERSLYHLRHCRAPFLLLEALITIVPIPPSSIHH